MSCLWMHNNDYAHDLQNVNACLTPRCYKHGQACGQPAQACGGRPHLAGGHSSGVSVVEHWSFRAACAASGSCGQGPNMVAHPRS